MVMTFIRDECGKLQEWTKNVHRDLKSIAIDGSEEDLIEVYFSIHNYTF